jgi:hypothetical protein
MEMPAVAITISGSDEPYEPGSSAGTWTMNCVRCGGQVPIENSFSDTTTTHATSIIANSPDHLEALRDLVRGLREMDPDSVAPDHLADELEESAPFLKPIADYLRAHASDVGVTIGVLVALLAWLFPDPLGLAEQPQPPPGIEKPDLDRIVEQLERLRAEEAKRDADREERDLQDRHNQAPGADNQGRNAQPQPEPNGKPGQSP